MMLLLLGASGGCSPCESLEQKICDDLGEENCTIWRENGRTALPDGRRAFKMCVNAYFGPTYSAILTGARASAEAMKDAKTPTPAR